MLSVRMPVSIPMGMDLEVIDVKVERTDLINFIFYLFKKIKIHIFR